MPVSLGRRIRRIGLLPSINAVDDEGKNIKRFNDRLTEEDKRKEIHDLRLIFALRRIGMREQRQRPAKKHRRTKARIQVVRADKIVVKGKK